MLQNEFPRKLMTEDGLVMSCVDMIEAINTTDAVRIDMEFNSRLCSRVMRRDFNRLSAKLFKISRKENIRKKVGKLIRRISIEASLATAAVENAGLSGCIPPADDRKVTKLSLRIVSNQARQIADALKAMDTALTRLTYGQKHDIASETWECFCDAYHDLSQYAFGSQKQAKLPPGLQDQQRLIHIRESRVRTSEDEAGDEEDGAATYFQCATG